MAITINGSGTVTGVSVGGLPDGIVDTDMLAANAVAAAKIGAEEVTKDKQGPGSIVQCLSYWKDTVWSTTGNSWHDITGLAGTITPTTNSNKILIICSLGKMHNTAGSAGIRYNRTISSSTEQVGIGSSSGAGSRPRIAFNTYGDDIYNNNHAGSYSHHYLDNPTTTNEITYQVQVYPEGSSVYLNRSNDDTDENEIYRGRASSSLTLMEIVA